MEQVLSVHVSQLRESGRSFLTILSPIFQLIRFFHCETQSYHHLFRSFCPLVFPGVLSSFATLFGQATESLYERFRDSLARMNVNDGREIDDTDLNDLLRRQLELFIVARIQVRARNDPAASLAWVLTKVIETVVAGVEAEEGQNVVEMKC
jgi:hypothetical protein